MEKLNTVNLLVLTGLDQLIFYIEDIYLFIKQGTLMRKSTVLNLPPQLVFRGLGFILLGITPIIFAVATATAVSCSLGRQVLATDRPIFA
jgi:hypothetical protein